MLRKSLCLALSLCVFLTTMPAPVRAYGPGGDVAELETDPGDFRPIIRSTGYIPPSSGQEEMAYFTATDLAGRLWNIDVNLTRARATYVADDGTVRSGELPVEQVEAFRAAAGLASSPDQRIQCLAHPVCAGIVGTVIAIGLTVLSFWTSCRMTMAHQARIAANEWEHCQIQLANGMARGQTCSLAYSRQEANPDDCFGGHVACSVHCSD
ncbi:MAG: hypothetical protein LPJ94_00920 [Thauera sp.]|uniref:hypothetical protein n=1 Tax=Rehaibacterium terrae TaxID=1341696 RepID=UPI0029C44FEB|nr:hypothetical protein [Thauera sp.]